MSKASKEATVKVGKKKVVKVEAKKEKVKKEKKEFDLSKAIDENANKISLNEGRLTAIPANIPEGAKGLKRNVFSTKTLYAEYQLYLLHKQSDKLAKKITDKEEEIKDLKTGGDPKMKRVKRVKKLKAQVEALIESLKADGIDPSEMGLEE